MTRRTKREVLLDLAREWLERFGKDRKLISVVGEGLFRRMLSYLENDVVCHRAIGRLKQKRCVRKTERHTEGRT